MATTDAIARGDAADVPGALAAALTGSGFFTAPAVVAVSGGADSVALLLALHAVASRGSAASRLVVAHARHDLREEAGDDAEFVRVLSGSLGLPCIVRDLPVRGARSGRGEGVEATARRARLGFFTAVAGDHGARHVALAHTADDQAETILHRVLRGTGPWGLHGMAAARALCEGVSLVRPLLAVPRAAVREYLAACGQAWREDATNADVRYARNFLRHELLPRCESGPYPAASAAVVRLGGQVAGLAGAIRSAADHLLETTVRRQADGSLLIRSAPLAPLAPQLVAEVFVSLWRREAWPQRDMTARHYALLARLIVESIDALPCAVDLPGGRRVSGVGRGMLRIEAVDSGR